MNLLFTSVGRRVELLRAFRRAYDELELRGEIVAVDIDPLAPALQEADRWHLIPRLGDEDYIPTLLEICRSDAIDLLIPLVDRDMPLLVKNRTAIEAMGTRPLIPTAKSATIVADE